MQFEIGGDNRRTPRIAFDHGQNSAFRQKQQSRPDAAHQLFDLRVGRFDGFSLKAQKIRGRFHPFVPFILRDQSDWLIESKRSRWARYLVSTVSIDNW